MDLIVGKAGFDFIESDVVSHLKREGVDPATIEQLNQADEIAAFNLLNGVTLFLEHIIRLEGYSDLAAGQRAMEDGSFRLRQLPVWESSAWMPFELAPGTLAEEPTFFVGSASELLRDLNDVAARSKLPLSTPPAAYRRMRDDFVGFERSQEPLDLSEDEIIRWIWCAFRDGAEIAVRERAVLCGTPN